MVDGEVPMTTLCPLLQMKSSSSTVFGRKSFIMLSSSAVSPRPSLLVAERTLSQPV